MSADFTRFDFHAKKFFFSENVQVMSAEEVGQYLLLLVYSWLGGKDASLPDNPSLLSRMARVTSVSDSVLAMFPIVETEQGPRRRNDTLFEEWQAAINRSDYGKKGGQSTSDAKCEAARENGLKGGRPSSNPTETQPNPTQSVPSQAVPSRIESGRFDSSQSKPSQPRVLTTAGVSRAVALEPTEEQNQVQEQTHADFKIFRRLFKNKKLDLGNDKKSQVRYEEACSKYGASTVHAAIDSWANEGTITWMKNNNIHSHFGMFLSQLEKTVERMSDDKTVDVFMIEADTIAEKIPNVLATKEAVDAADDVIMQLVAEEERSRAERIAKFSIEPEVTVDPEKFLED